VRDTTADAITGRTNLLARFQYDFDGRRNKKIGEDGIRQYVYDQTSTFLEYDENGLQVAKYDYGSDRLISQTRAGGLQYYSFDALGSVTNLSDSAGTVAASYHLDAWGQYRFPAELSASANRFGFTGYIFDRETDLHYARARYYDGEFGRFTTQDSFLGSIGRPPRCTGMDMPTTSQPF
jgi:RHS repeat-associated protein